MEITIVIIVVLIGAIITAVKLRKILTGKDTNCSCSGNCPFAGDLNKCTGYKNTCGYPEKTDPNEQKKGKSDTEKE